MTKAEAGSSLQLAPGARVGIVAGGGSLPVQLAEALKQNGCPPFVVLVIGEAEPGSPLESFDHETLELEQFGSLVPMLKRHGVTHLVLAGEVKRRPSIRAIRVNAGLLSLLPSFPAMIAGLMRGDDGLLRALMRTIERRGIKMVGAHEVVPELVANEGVLTKAAPSGSDWRDIEAARTAARAIGALDIGQAAIAIGGRAVATEDIEGTAALLERAKSLRGHGRLAGKKRGVLVKCAKPGQEIRADMPSIGPRTVEAAHAAGLAGIAVEAGRSLILEGPQVIGRADALGLFVVGLPASELVRDR